MLGFLFGIDENVTIFAAFHIFKGRLVSVKAGIFYARTKRCKL